MGQMDVKWSNILLRSFNTFERKEDGGKLSFEVVMFIIVLLILLVVKCEVEMKVDPPSVRLRKISILLLITAVFFTVYLMTGS